MKRFYLVDTDIPMSKKMMGALSLFETNCVGRRIKIVDTEDVVTFIREEYTPQLAAAFKPEFLSAVPNGYK